MCQNRTYNNRIVRLQERCLQLICSDKCSSFEDLVEKDNSVFIQNKNPQTLAIELFKAHTKTSPEIIQEVFCLLNSKSNSEIKQIFVIP